MTRRSRLNVTLWILAAALPLHAACSRQAPGDQQAATAAINDIWSRYSSSLNSGDIDRWMSLCADSGVMETPNEHTVIGKKAIRTRHKGALDRIDFSQTITKHGSGVGGDCAFARGNFAATLNPQA